MLILALFKNQFYTLSLPLSLAPSLCFSLCLSPPLSLCRIKKDYTHTSLKIGQRSNTDFTNWELSL